MFVSSFKLLISTNHSITRLTLLQKKTVQIRDQLFLYTIPGHELLSTKSIL